MTEQKQVWNKEEKWAPFDKDGSLLDWGGWPTHEWREVSKPLLLKLYYSQYFKRGSSVQFQYEDSNGSTYPLSLKTVGGFLAKDIDPRSVQGSWRVANHGGTYRLELGQWMSPGEYDEVASSEP